MEGGGGGGRRSVGGCGRPRTTLLDQMSSAVADGRDLAGLTLDDILAKEKRPVPAPPPAPAPPLVPAGRTLLDIIRDEDPKARTCKAYNGNRDKKCWKSFKERLRLKRSGAVWTSSVHIPTSDIIIPDNRSQFSRHNSVRRHTTAQFFADSPPHMSHPDDSSDIAAGGGGHDSRPQMSRRSSSRFTSHTSFRSDSTPDNDDAFENSHGGSPAGPVPSLRPQMSRRVSSRISPAAEDNVADPTDPPREGSRRLSVVLAEERSLSAREAVAAQEAAEAEAAAAAIAVAEAEESEWAPVPDTSAAPETDSGQQVRMSLMDLLEETDRQMGFVGSRYTIGDAEEEVEEEEEEKEVVEEVVVGGVDQNCCVCMVRHKGAAFIPCGHTFCRLCSRELWVSRGNCPLCNGFILEILDIF